MATADADGFVSTAIGSTLAVVEAAVHSAELDLDDDTEYLVLRYRYGMEGLSIGKMGKPRWCWRHNDGSDHCLVNLDDNVDDDVTLVDNVAVVCVPKEQTVTSNVNDSAILRMILCWR